MDGNVTINKGRDGQLEVERETFII